MVIFFLTNLFWLVSVSAMRQIIKLLLDFGPLLAFFVSYKLGGLMTATVTLIILTALSLLITYAWEKKIAMAPLISGVLVAVLGSLTLYLNDELFIKLKPTLVNLLFAAILAGGLIFQKPTLRYVLGHAISLRDEGWRLLTRRWAFFFLFLAVLNEIIWRNFSTDFWVDFKVFGMFSLTLLFTLAQLPLIQRHWREESKN